MILSNVPLYSTSKHSTVLYSTLDPDKEDNQNMAIIIAS